MVLPPPIGMADPSSFAHYTWKTRWRKVVQEVQADPRYGVEVGQRLDALLQEMETGSVLASPDTYGSDLDAWQRDLVPYRDRPWIELPWFFAEVYFFRRLLAATHYFHPDDDDYGLDPFAPFKVSSLEKHHLELRSLVAAFAALQEESWQTVLRAGFLRMLWGNQADLSLRPGEPLAIVQHDSIHHHLLVNQTEEAIAHLSQPPLHRVDLIADNAGIELVGDLAWIDGMFTTNIAQTVHIHLKSHPTFVSDATPADLDITLHHLAKDPDPDLPALASRLQQAIASKRLQVCADPFWTAPRVFWAMPEALYQDLATSDLLVFKGDAHYRRILGDRQWDTTANFGAIAHYLPAPSLVLRTLKSELVVGLAPGRAEEIAAEDPDWQTNGRWSVIQYLERNLEITSQ